MAYIYKITNKINGKIYIGKTSKSVEKRWKEHCNDFQKERCERRPLYSAMKKYGIENFSIEEIEQCDNPEERETYWIEYYGSFKNGYNATKGGDGKPYIDRQLVIKTYGVLRNCVKTAEVTNISLDSVYNILKSNNIEIKSSQSIIKENFSRPVAMFDKKNNFIKSFSSLKDAAKYLIEIEKTKCDINGITSHIREVCNNKRKSAYTFIWRFI